MGGRERVMWWILIMNVRWSTVRFFDLDTPVRRTNDIFYLNVSEDLDEVWAAGGVPRCFNSTPIIARLSTIVYLIHASENYITRGVLRFSSRSFYINLSRGWAVHRFSFCFSFSFFFKKKREFDYSRLPLGTASTRVLQWTAHFRFRLPGILRFLLNANTGK